MWYGGLAKWAFCESQETGIGKLLLFRHLWLTRFLNGCPPASHLPSVLCLVRKDSGEQSPVAQGQQHLSVVWDSVLTAGVLTPGAASTRC